MCVSGEVQAAGRRGDRGVFFYQSSEFQLPHPVFNVLLNSKEVLDDYD